LLAEKTLLTSSAATGRNAAVREMRIEGLEVDPNLRFDL
jgi:hypothetical protein